LNAVSGFARFALDRVDFREGRLPGGWICSSARVAFAPACALSRPKAAFFGFRFDVRARRDVDVPAGCSLSC
jgi:hypothetical protein